MEKSRFNLRSLINDIFTNALYEFICDYFLNETVHMQGDYIC